MSYLTCPELLAIPNYRREFFSPRKSLLQGEALKTHFDLHRKHLLLRRKMETGGLLFKCLFKTQLLVKKVFYVLKSEYVWDLVLTHFPSSTENVL